ncbi:zinc knuckle CX2CX4HX4C containing protein [Tanacetum coccineum]
MSSCDGVKANDAAKPMSFASNFHGNLKKTVNISELHNKEVVEGAPLAIPFAAVEELHNEEVMEGAAMAISFAGYVKNTWAKFGLERVMLQNGFFFFQFSTREGMERVLENGSWLIRLVPLLLNIWSPNSMLKKDEITLAPVWVKLHNVPIVAYSEMGLSLITKKVGRPIMLDAYTSDMCLNPWGHNNYTRAFIEVSVAQAFLNSLVVAIPLPNGKGHTLETIEIEYEWQPPHCKTCKIFDHTDMHCPKRDKTSTETLVAKEDEIINPNEDSNRASKASSSHGATKDANPTSKKSSPKKGNSYFNDDISFVYLKNSFEKLMKEDK